MNWDAKNRRLADALTLLNSPEDARHFLRDLLTEAEISEFARRLKAADMLSRGMSYKKVEKETGFSSATVARVSKWLRHGEGGYVAVLKRLKLGNV